MTADMSSLQIEEDDWNVNFEKLEVLQDRFKDEEFPLFMEDIPSDLSGNKHLEALQHILFEEQTPEERASSFREQGNVHFGDASNSDNKLKRLKDALQCYSEGINQKCSDSKLNSLLYSNRAHVHLLLGDYPKCVDDARAAIKEDVYNIKAYFRGAKASYYLRLFAQSSQLCNAGLQYEPHNIILQHLLEQSTTQWNIIKERRHETIQQRLKETNQLIDNLNQAYKERGLQVSKHCQYDISILQGRLVWLDTDLNLHWSCLILYPEYNISETIIDFQEELCLLDHLNIMFPGNGTFAPWDTQQSYVYNKLAVYYEDGTSDHIIRKITTTESLKDILTKIGHVGVIPVFHIMVQGSNVENDFILFNRIGTSC